MNSDNLWNDIKYSSKKVYFFKSEEKMHALLIYKDGGSENAKISFCNFCCPMSTPESKNITEIIKLIEENSMVDHIQKDKILVTFPNLTLKLYDHYCDMFDKIEINENNEICNK
uniref:Uncharacterized protein n=1 Tax=viral metagenome TaxID=1070528 RepID=A0A6C0JB87_9ZZZZ